MRPRCGLALAQYIAAMYRRLQVGGGALDVRVTDGTTAPPSLFRVHGCMNGVNRRASRVYQAILCPELRSQMTDRLRGSSPDGTSSGRSCSCTPSASVDVSISFTVWNVHRGAEHTGTAFDSEGGLLRIERDGSMQQTCRANVRIGVTHHSVEPDNEITTL
jgi:hypothetical protein